MVQLFWGQFFEYVFYPFWNLKKEKEKESKSSQQPASQQYICQYKIQPIVPNTFSNKESIAHKDSIHNLLNLLEKVYSLYFIVRGGGRGFTNHLSTLEKQRQHPAPTHHEAAALMTRMQVWNFLHPSGAAKRRFSSWEKREGQRLAVIYLVVKISDPLDPRN